MELLLGDQPRPAISPRSWRSERARVSLLTDRSRSATPPVHMLSKVFLLLALAARASGFASLPKAPAEESIEGRSSAVVPN